MEKIRIGVVGLGLGRCGSFNFDIKHVCLHRGLNCYLILYTRRLRISSVFVWKTQEYSQYSHIRGGKTGTDSYEAS